MPPRIPGPQGLSTLHLCIRPAAKRLTPSLQPLIQTANLTLEEKKRMAKQEPYRWAQYLARKAVNVERKTRFKEARDATWGDPVHGIPTPYVVSFDSAGQQSVLSSAQAGEAGQPAGEPLRSPTSPELLNHQLTRQERDEAIAMAYQLSKPIKNENRVVVDAVTEAQDIQEHEERHRKAVIAIERITALENANSKGLLHANIRRCIDSFGRHNTDKVLKRGPRSPDLPPPEVLARAGPDTGSPEVQVAILTAKIRRVAQTLNPKKDKLNKRNLRKLCHRRQKLLRYLNRKERGSERWQNLITTLGLSPATWKEQISI